MPFRFRKSVTLGNGVVMGFRLAALALGAALTSGACVGATLEARILSPSPKPTFTPPTTYSGRIGTQVELGNWRYSVRQVDVTGDAIQCGSNRFSTTDKPKGLWVSLLLDITNVGRENFTLNAHDIELRDDKGIVYHMASFASSSCSRGRGQASLGEQMPPTVTVRTTLLYDVAPGTGGMYLYLVQGKGTIRLE